MALNKFYGHNFHKKIVFGKTVKIRDENDGSMKMAFKSLTEPFFCAPVIRTMHQNFEAEGTKFQGTRQVGVNHQWVVSKSPVKWSWPRLISKFTKLSIIVRMKVIIPPE